MFYRVGRIPLYYFTYNLDAQFTHAKRKKCSALPGCEANFANGSNWDPQWKATYSIFRVKRAYGFRELPPQLSLSLLPPNKQCVPICRREWSLVNERWKIAIVESYRMWRDLKKSLKNFQVVCVSVLFDFKIVFSWTFNCEILCSVKDWCRDFI